MAYFPNGTAGDIYQEGTCEKCANWRVDASGSVGCPIIDLHGRWNYEQHDDETKRAALSHFIPMDGVYPGDCVMFLSKDWKAEQAAAVEQASDQQKLEAWKKAVRQ